MVSYYRAKKTGPADGLAVDYSGQEVYRLGRHSKENQAPQIWKMRARGAVTKPHSVIFVKISNFLTMNDRRKKTPVLTKPEKTFCQNSNSLKMKDLRKTHPENRTFVSAFCQSFLFCHFFFNPCKMGLREGARAFDIIDGTSPRPSYL